MREKYEEYIRRQKEMASAPMGRLWTNQESRYIEPFRLFGNVYYVGDSWVCVHLIDTGDGLLLLDAGNCGATAMLIHAIWSLGFNPADVRWVILSHGHLDHFGAAVFMRRMFGSKIYLGEPDAKMFRERPELSLIQENPDVSHGLFEPDEIIRDGDVKRFGNTEIKFYLVPGHTMGAIACFFDVTDGTSVMRAGFFGGLGFNTLGKDYLIEIGDTEYKTRQICLGSIAKVRNEHVDIFLNNHVDNRFKKKLALMRENQGGNPFVDPSTWGEYLDEKRDALIAFMADPKNI
ncbi:MAG TPA: MBL fold metallo-hydrolase [Clostridiales bacterium]|nr:MBL fold metallo-hydrolase [Clostridiales bacterium]